MNLAEGIETAKPAEPEQNLRRAPAHLKVLTVVLLSGVVPALISFVVHSVLGTTPGFLPTLHEAMEAMGGCIALAVAMLIWLRTQRERSSHLLWVVAALVAMGLMDSAHAAVPLGAAWFWLRHGATLAGGLLFALVWVPLPAGLLRRQRLFLFSVAAVALLASVAICWRPEWLPVVSGPDGYTTPVKGLNFLGGIGFLAASLFFLRRYREKSFPEDLVFASQTLLFTASCLWFGFSHLWAADWWLCHCWRLIAYFLGLVAAYDMVVALYQKIAAHAGELERRVESRTADLRRLAAIVESSDDAIITKTLDGVIRTWNEAAARLYGYTAAEAIGRPLTLIVPPELRQELPDLLRRIAGGRPGEHYETVRVRKNGHRVDVSVTLSPLKDMHGRVTGASAVVRDITAQKAAERARIASEELLRNVIDSSSDSIFVKDRELRTILCNRTYARALAKSAGDICGKTDLENGWDRELVYGNPSKGIKGWEADDRAALAGETVRAIAEWGDAAEEARVFETIRSPIRDAQGETIGLVGISRDISDRIRMEAARRESDAAFRMLADAVPQIVWICTPDGLCVYFNQQWVDYTGLTLEESYGTGWDEPFHPADKQATWDAWNHATASGETYRIESRLRARDGNYRWFLMRGLAVRDAGGRIMKWVGTCTDIHELKRAEERLSRLNEELRQAGAYNRSLIEASLDPLVTIAPDGKITDVNQATEQATGFSRQALIGTDFCDYFTDPQKARTGYQHVFRAGWTQDYELELRHRNGTTKAVVYNASIYRNEAGETVGVFAAARDITERKRVEEEFRKLNASLEHRVAERTAELVTLNQELESFNYSVSHDLRAPLRHIDGYSKILFDRHGPEVSEDGRLCMERIRQGARRMGRMVDELLELSRTSRREVSKQLTGLGSLVRDVIEDLKPELQDREIEWSIGELPFVDCDPMLTRQVFVNLLSNAVKFTRGRKPARIEVGQTTSQGKTVFFIRDNGVGFSMKYADKLFGVFQRLHRSEDFEGTGVGLVTVQRILHKHGGRIWAEAELEKGASFFFTLEPSGDGKAEGIDAEPVMVLSGER